MVEVDKIWKGLDITPGLWNKLLTNSRNLDWVYLNSVFRADQSQILYLLLLKLAFFQVERVYIQPRSPKLFAPLSYAP